jgi:hypothetical protein
MPTEKRVFVTSGNWSGDLQDEGGGTDGLSGADSLCNAAASNAGLGGSWVAWLSTQATGPTAATRAVDRIHDVSPWVLVDGVTVAVSSFDQLASGALGASIDEDETGAPSTNHVWTGTNGDMTAGNECNDWTSSSPINIGLYGLASDADVSWTEQSNYSCAASFSLYCFEQ